MAPRVGIVVVVFSLLAAGGCPPANGPGPGPSGSTLKLPAEVAGTWKAKESPWEIVLSRDGTVSSAVIPMGEVRISPNETTKVEMKDGSFSTYEAGDCLVEYTPASRELFVSIVMKEIHVVFLDNRIDGNSTDRFVGTVSEDGKVWTTDWIQVFDYGPRFPQDANDVGAALLVFEKVEP
ncbi:MAG: hypothetical protein JSU94_21745 [Phycisphaerales bacterium]|nr:MAG: hypothetical protein JSU94_21745 [Phycisphaerales bacterium]